MSNWFWARAGDRRGPISFDQLRSMVSSGQIVSTDLAWTAGMAEWKAIGQIPDLASPAPAPAPAQVDPAVAVVENPVVAQASLSAPLSYFGTGMPPRAEKNLRGHARPSGDVGAWPLDDAQLAQFNESLKLRKRIYSAAQLFRSLMYLSIVVVAIMVIVVIVSAASGPRNRAPALAGLLITGVVLAGLCALYWALWRFTLRSHRWAPLTFFIICAVGIAGNILSMMLVGAASMGSQAAMPVFASNMVSLLIGFAFAVVSWRASSAIPKYLSQPAWCQELIATAKM